MAYNTLVHHIKRSVIGAPYDNPPIQVAQATHTIPIENGSGYMSCVLQTFEHDSENGFYFRNIKSLYFLWRQILPGVQTRWLPMYIDLEADPPAGTPPILMDAQQYGRPPDFALAANLSSEGANPKFAQGKAYNLYTVRPNVPESVPLLQDIPQGAHSGIEIMVQLINTDDPVEIYSRFSYEMWFFWTVFV